MVAIADKDRPLPRVGPDQAESKGKNDLR